jgi:molybdopterin/thiamine biosynthesis adenylyltransferase
VTDLSSKTALIVGLGGLGCPAALALARAKIGRLVLVDDDEVSVENLHRQILYRDRDVGRDKIDVAAERLASQTTIQKEKTRFLPENALSLLKGVDIIVEGSDNFATKFLTSDAALLAGLPVVHGAGIRWHGTALLVRPQGKPCYRCIFEDLLPDDQAPACSTAGVVGPLVGLVGALMADLALSALASDWSRAGQVLSVDGWHRKYRAARFHPRAGCGCDSDAAKPEALSRNRYLTTPPCP